MILIDRDGVYKGNLAEGSTMVLIPARKGAIREVRAGREHGIYLVDATFEEIADLEDAGFRFHKVRVKGRDRSEGKGTASIEIGTDLLREIEGFAIASRTSPRRIVTRALKEWIARQAKEKARRKH